MGDWKKENNKRGEKNGKKVLCRIISILLLGMLSFPLSAQDNYEIRKIRFKGNKTFSRAELLDQVSMHQTNFIQKIQRKEPSLYSQDFMEQDLERLTRFYQSEGFLHANIFVDSLKVNEKKNRVNIYIHIEEKRPVLVDTVSLVITEPLANRNADSLVRAISKNLSMKNRSRFRDNGVYDDISTINNAFLDLGYVYGQTYFDLDLQSTAQKVHISYGIQPGNISMFGETTITGNRYVNEKMIRKQLAYMAGGRYCRDLLDKTRKNLYNLQLFRVVSITPQTDPENKENPIPVTILIQEMPRWMSNFGIGYGTEDKFRAFADVTFRGIFGGTSRLNLYAKHSALTPYYVSLSWIEPRFFVNRLSVSVNPYIERQNEPGYNTQTIGLNFPVAYRVNDHINTSLSYYLQKVTQHVESDDADIPNPEENRFLYNKSGISALFAFNNSDPVFSPVRGWAVSFGAKVNGYIFGTDFNYTRLWVDVRKYFHLGRFSFALRAMGGAIHSSDSSGFIPVEDRFYSGGSNSNRGWGRSELGPKRESGTPLGGKSILEFNFEIRHPLFWRIEIAAFVDAGNVWTQGYHYRFKELACSVGGGLRVTTPIGPIRLDIGVPLASENKTVHFFISVGQAF